MSSNLQRQEIVELLNVWNDVNEELRQEIDNGSPACVIDSMRLHLQTLDWHIQMGVAE